MNNDKYADSIKVGDRNNGFLIDFHVYGVRFGNSGKITWALVGY